MLDSELSDLANARLLNAKDCLLQANALLNVEQYKGVANRAYYAVFHAMRAALALDGFDSKKHSGIIAKFRESYIKINLFDAEISETISTLFRVRSASDYQKCRKAPCFSYGDIRHNLLENLMFFDRVNSFICIIHIMVI